MSTPLSHALALGLDHHCHLDDPDVDGPALLQSLQQLVGWQGSLIAGYGPERFGASRKLCQASPQLVRAVGLHPYWLADHQAQRQQMDDAWRLLQAELFADGVVAIGETGLDKTRRDLLDLDQQLVWFGRHLALARQHNLPLVLHVVGWHGHALALLQSMGGPWSGAVHRFSGSPEVAIAYQDLGLHVSLSLEPRESEAKRLAVVRSVAPDRLLLETDWPFLDLTYPQALQAMQVLLRRTADWLGEPAIDLAARLAHNARAAYAWPAPPAALP